MVLLGRRQRARRAQGRGPGPARHRDPDDHRPRPAGQLHARAAPPPWAPRAAARRRDPGWALGDRAGERRLAEHRPQPVRGRAGQAGAAARALRRPAPARADDAGDLHGDARVGGLPARRHVPRLGQPGVECDREAGLGIPDGSARPPHRRHGSGTGVGGTLVSGRLRADSERRLDPSRGGRRGTREQDRVRRAARSAQGDGGAPSSVAGDPPADRRAVAARGCGPADGPAGACEGRRDGGRDRSARLPQSGGAHRGASGRESARCALAGRRELRDGADACLCLCHACRRIGHRWVP